MPLLELLFPPRCFGCAAAGTALCAGCRGSVAVVTPPVCARCGRPWEERLVACTDCPPEEIAAARAPFLYQGPMATAIRSLKFSGWKVLARHLAGAMAEVWDLDADVVTWVPLSRRRRSRRGFDQAELLARPVGRRLGLPVRGLLVRSRDTPPQARRGGEERRRALRDAFRAVGRPSRTVLLVDDVLTTGATAAACARALGRRGSERVFLLTAARAARGPVPARSLGTPGPRMTV